LAPCLLPFHGSNRHVGKLTHFVAKEILRPIPDVAISIHVECLDARCSVLKVTKIEGGVLWFESFSRDPSLDSPQKVLPVALNNDLQVPVHNCINQNIGQSGLSEWMQMYLRLLEKQY
jgi:hypothetical protein